jgi:hypothetical protein
MTRDRATYFQVKDKRLLFRRRNIIVKNLKIDPEINCGRKSKIRDTRKLGERKSRERFFLKVGLDPVVGLDVLGIFTMNSGRGGNKTEQAGGEGCYEYHLGRFDGSCVVAIG